MNQNRKYWMSFFLVMISLSNSLMGQNIVPNPSFEIYTTCPSAQAQINYAQSWTAHNNSTSTTPADFYHSCSSGFGTPTNWGGYQVPASGNGYISLFTFFGSVREIVGAQLSTPMIVGQMYYVSMKASLILQPTLSANVGTDKLGIKFASVNYTPATNYLLINSFAHMDTDSIVADTVNWTTISGTFIADSAYQYVYVGNFFSTGNTDTIHLAAPNPSFPTYWGAYYFVDDICVSEDSTDCDMGILTTILSKQEMKVKVYPNPADRDIHILLDRNYLNCNIRLTDILGKEKMNVNFSGKEYLLNINGRLPSGIYFIQISCEKNLNFVEKIIVE